MVVLVLLLLLLLLLLPVEDSAARPRDAAVASPLL